MSNSVELDMGKGALIPSLVVGVCGLIASGFLRGSSGILGALLAHVVVIIFFIVHLFVSKISRNLDPMMTMILALISYFSKMIILGAFMLILMSATNPKTLDRPSFGLVAVAITLAWLGGEIRAFLKLRLHLPLPKIESSGKVSGALVADVNKDGEN